MQVQELTQVPSCLYTVFKLDFHDQHSHICHLFVLGGISQRSQKYTISTLALCDQPSDLGLPHHSVLQLFHLSTLSILISNNNIDMTVRYGCPGSKTCLK
jgi:hypothetical protein